MYTNINLNMQKKKKYANYIVKHIYGHKNMLVYVYICRNMLRYGKGISICKNPTIISNEIEVWVAIWLGLELSF